MNSFAQSAGFSSSIFGDTTGSSGSLGSLDMSSMMEMMMMMKMMESMGFDMSEFTEGESGDGTTSSGTTTTGSSVLPTTRNFASKISINNASAVDVSQAEKDADGNIINFSLGYGADRATYNTVMGVNAGGQNKASNVFKTEQGEYYFYNNGQMSEITNENNLSDNSVDADDILPGVKLAYNNVVYNQVKKEGDGFVLYKKAGDTTGVTVTKIGSTTGSGTGVMGTSEVYMIGDKTFELRAGVFVPRSTTITTGGTINILASESDAEGNNFGTVQDITTDEASGLKTIIVKIGNTETEYTQVKETATDKFVTTSTFYTDGSTYYVVKGGSLVQIDPNDPKYLQGYDKLGGSYNGFALKTSHTYTDDNGTSQTAQNVKFEYYTKTEGGVTKLFRVTKDSNGNILQGATDVSTDPSAFARAGLDKDHAYKISEASATSITLQLGATASTADDLVFSNSDNTLKEGYYKLTNGNLPEGSGYTMGGYYKFENGKLIPVSKDDPRIYAQFEDKDGNLINDAQASGSKHVMLDSSNQTRYERRQYPGLNEYYWQHQTYSITNGWQDTLGELKMTLTDGKFVKATKQQ